MTLSELTKQLNFVHDEREIIMRIDEQISSNYIDLYSLIYKSYIEGVDSCINSIKDSANKIQISEESLGLWFCLKLAIDRMLCGYRRLGIDENFFVAATANIVRYKTATENELGRFGINIQRYLRAFGNLVELRAFRIGAFNFEFIEMDRDIETPGIKIGKGERCVSLHIPINTDISADKVDENFRQAKEFFSKHFGMGLTCLELYSWLLHPSIEECLPEESRLVKFFKRFYLYEVKDSPASPIEYVFGTSCAEEYKKDKSAFEAFPEDTVLQRKFKERLRLGLPIGVAKGITVL